MKKKGNGRLIEKVMHGPFDAEIRMNDEGVFTCEYGAFKNAGTLPEMRTWAKETLRKLTALEWRPVMSVHLDREDMTVNNLRNCSQLECRIERMWVAWDGAKWIECPWVVDRQGTVMCSGPANSEREQDDMPAEQLMSQRIAKSRAFYDGPKGNRIDWPLQGKGYNNVIYYVPFTEERWQTMLGILDRVRELRKGIHKLLATSAGWQVLAKVAQTNLLPDRKQEG